MKLSEGDVQNILSIGDDEIYRANRYKLPLTLVILKSKEYNKLEKSLRQSDILQQLNPELICMYLTHTDDEGAVRYLRNIREDITFGAIRVEFNGSRADFTRELDALKEE